MSVRLVTSLSSVGKVGSNFILSRQSRKRYYLQSVTSVTVLSYVGNFYSVGKVENYFIFRR